MLALFLSLYVLLCILYVINTWERKLLMNTMRIISAIIDAVKENYN